jgi:hypothetical protein
MTAHAGLFVLASVAGIPDQGVEVFFVGHDSTSHIATELIEAELTGFIGLEIHSMATLVSQLTFFSIHISFLTSRT